MVSKVLVSLDTPTSTLDLLRQRRSCLNLSTHLGHVGKVEAKTKRIGAPVAIPAAIAMSPFGFSSMLRSLMSRLPSQLLLLHGSWSDAKHKQTLNRAMPKGAFEKHVQKSTSSLDSHAYSPSNLFLEIVRKRIVLHTHTLASRQLQCICDVTAMSEHPASIMRSHLLYKSILNYPVYPLSGCHQSAL